MPCGTFASFLLKKGGEAAKHLGICNGITTFGYTIPINLLHLSMERLHKETLC